MVTRVLADQPAEGLIPTLARIKVNAVEAASGDAALAQASGLKWACYLEKILEKSFEKVTDFTCESNTCLIR
jgi:hypothetical protein